MKAQYLLITLTLTSFQTIAGECELLGKSKPVGTQILITNSDGKSYEILCAEVAEMHYVNGKAQIKTTQARWAKKITNDEGEDCW